MSAAFGRWSCLLEEGTRHWVDCPACTGHVHCPDMEHLDEQCREAWADVDSQTRARHAEADNL